jgi:hypothetical protein
MSISRSMAGNSSLRASTWESQERSTASGSAGFQPPLMRLSWFLLSVPLASMTSK